MKQNMPDIHCIYTETQRSLGDLLKESFRLYLIRTLATPETSAVQCSR